VQGDTGAVRGGAMRAALTVTMAALKPGLLLGDGPDLSGRVEVADIGLPVGEPSAHLVEDADLAWIPPRPRAAHKWMDAVFVVAGSPGLRGASQFCTRAALRAGSGLVQMGSPGLGADDHQPSEAVAVGLPAAGWDTAVAADLTRVRALAVGPGLGRSEAAGEGVWRLLASTAVATVVDADGLFALGGAGQAAAVIGSRPAGAGPVVFTPHDGEFARLAGAPAGEDRIGAVRRLAAATGAVVLLKGPTTVVADPGGAVLLANSGDARLATPGTGDVLTGVAAAFLAKGLDGLRAAAVAAHVHGRAALLGPRVGFVAGDLPDLISRVLSEKVP
jgi:ADP-dependent NAD(P)H-hydrate dehydratase / NAD(P)H-hydrate epimerase